MEFFFFKVLCEYAERRSPVGMKGADTLRCETLRTPRGPKNHKWGWKKLLNLWRKQEKDSINDVLRKPEWVRIKISDFMVTQKNRRLIHRWSFHGINVENHQTLILNNRVSLNSLHLISGVSSSNLTTWDWWLKGEWIPSQRNPPTGGLGLSGAPSRGESEGAHRGACRGGATTCPDGSCSVKKGGGAGVGGVNRPDGWTGEVEDGTLFIQRKCLLLESIGRAAHIEAETRRWNQRITEPQNHRTTKPKNQITTEPKNQRTTEPPRGKHLSLY